MHLIFGFFVASKRARFLLVFFPIAGKLLNPLQTNSFRFENVKNQRSKIADASFSNCFVLNFSSRNSAKVFSWLRVAELFMLSVEQTSKCCGWQHVTWKSPGCLALQGQTPTRTLSPINSPAFQAPTGYKAFAYKLQALNEDTASDPLHLVGLLNTIRSLYLVPHKQSNRNRFLDVLAADLWNGSPPLPLTRTSQSTPP